LIATVAIATDKDQCLAKSECLHLSSMPTPQKIAHRLNQMSSLVANQINAMLAYWDMQLVCRFANDAYLEWFGKTKEEMIDKITLKELLGPALYEKNLPYIKEALKGNKQVFEREIPTPDGKSLRHSLATYFPDVANGEVKGFFVHVADVSYIKQLEALLAKLRLDMLRNVIETQEAERVNISVQLRDSVNQTLTHCKLLLQTRSNNEDRNNTDKILEQGIDKAIRELNLLSTNLIPSAIQDFGFIAGTNMYIESNIQNLSVKFICTNKAVDELSLPVKLSLFRIVQSFLTIVTEQKNENAVHILITYENKNIEVQLSIADENFMFGKATQFTDITRRVQYYGGSMEELLVRNKKILLIRIAL
jgi:PAS domain S-box-containing protein